MSEYNIPGRPSSDAARLSDFLAHFPTAEPFTVAIAAEVGEADTRAEMTGGNPPGTTLFGHVNREPFLGRAAETCLYAGMQSAADGWHMLFAYRPEGWNTALYPGDGKYYRVYESATGRPLYPISDFAPLAALEKK